MRNKPRIILERLLEPESEVVRMADDYSDLRLDPLNPPKYTITHNCHCCYSFTLLLMKLSWIILIAILIANHLLLPRRYCPHCAKSGLKTKVKKFKLDPTKDDLTIMCKNAKVHFLNNTNVNNILIH